MTQNSSISHVNADDGKKKLAHDVVVDGKKKTVCASSKEGWSEMLHDQSINGGRTLMTKMSTTKMTMTKMTWIFKAVKKDVVVKGDAMVMARTISEDKLCKEFEMVSRKK